MQLRVLLLIQVLHNIYLFLSQCCRYFISAFTTDFTAEFQLKELGAGAKPCDLQFFVQIAVFVVQSRSSNSMNVCDSHQFNAPEN